MADGAQAPGAGRERHFLPRKSRASWLIAFLLGLLTLFLGVGWLAMVLRPAPGDGAGPKIFLGLLVLLCAAGVWYSARSAGSRKPVLTLGRQGIGARNLRQPIAWSELDDVELTQSMGHAYLDLKLRAGKKPRRGFLGRHIKVHRIDLTRLKPDDQFAAYATIHARLAPLREAAGLGAAPSVQQAQEATAFEQQLDALTPTPWALYLVMALNIGVWLLNVVQGISPTRPAPAELFAWGANSAYAVTIDGQYWRLLTATFLHAGLMHLALNMVGLWEAGRQICRWFGNGQFLLIYLGSAFAGSALSLHFSSQNAVGVGASGAVFGVLGAVLMAVWRHRERIPAVIAKRLMTGQGIFVAYALLQGFTKPGIDNAAHVGGLLAGMLLTVLLVQQMGQLAEGGQRLLRQGLAVIVTAVAVIGLVLSTPAPKVHHRQLFETQAALQNLLPQLQAEEQALKRDALETSAGRLTSAQFSERLRDTHLPTYRRLNAAFLPLQLAPGQPLHDLLVDMQAVQRLTEEWLSLQVQQFDLVDQARQQPEGTNPALVQELLALQVRGQEKNAQLMQARKKLDATVAASKPQTSGR